MLQFRFPAVGNCLVYCIAGIVHYVTMLCKNKIYIYGAYFYIYYECKTETRRLMLRALYPFLMRRRAMSLLPDFKNCCNMIIDIVAR
jgi:hypothetical protein